MANTTYTYTETDFSVAPSDIDPTKLALSVLDNPSIGPVFVNASFWTDGSTALWKPTFSRELTTGEKTELDTIVATHDPSVPEPVGYTVAELAAQQPVTAGETAFARDGRKEGEGFGAGTGVLAYSDGSAWRSCDGGPLQA